MLGNLHLQYYANIRNIAICSYLSLWDQLQGQNLLDSRGSSFQPSSTSTSIWENSGSAVTVSSPFRHRFWGPRLRSSVEKGESHRRKIFGMEPRQSNGKFPGSKWLVTVGSCWRWFNRDSHGFGKYDENIWKYDDYPLDMVVWHRISPPNWSSTNSSSEQCLLGIIQ